MSNLSYVIKLTGYIFNLNDSDNYKELYNLSKYIKELYSQRRRFVIVVGGGAFLRRWIDYLRKYSKVSEFQLDLLGIQFTTLNARIMSMLLYPTAVDTIPKSIEEAVVLAKESDKNIVLGGVSPGFSTNAVAAYLAGQLSVDLINMTRVGAVYTKDPEVYDDAEKIDQISISMLSKLLSSYKESAGHYPLLDRTSLKILKKYKIRTYIIPATVSALKNLLQGSCEGTIVYPE